MKRPLLGALVAGCAVVTVMLAVDGRLAAAAATALGGVYFALRFLGVLGR